MRPFNKAKPGQLSQYFNGCYQLLKSFIIDSSVLHNLERLSKNEQTIVLGYYAIRKCLLSPLFKNTQILQAELNITFEIDLERDLPHFSCLFFGPFECKPLRNSQQ